MNIVWSIAAAVAAPIISPLMEPVKRNFGYLFFYEEKIQELRSEIQKLGGKKGRIQEMVKIARRNSESIEFEVSTWLNKVQEKEDEVCRFLEGRVVENENGFRGLCPDLLRRYRLGKEAEDKKLSVTTLIEEGRELRESPVSHPAPYPEDLLLASSGDYMVFESRDSVLKGIMEALQDSEVNLIGVHGPGGAGKTTLVKEAAKQAKKDRLFDEIVMAVVSKDPDVSKIQKQLAAKLNLTYKQDSEDGRAGELWNRLKEGNRKILVIMDDVWEQLDLKKIGIPIADGNRGCKVLLTSRREGVCQRMEVKDFRVGVLEEQEAWSLFNKAVGDVPTEVIQSDAKEVCKECGGLPVAIVAVGVALKRKKVRVWKDALNQLKNSSLQEIPDIDPKLYTSLKWSYDYLEHEEAKSCFLLCCLYPEDANIPIEDLVKYCVALSLLRHAETLEMARNRVQAMVDLLKSSYLLLPGRNENYVKMHDVIRDVAIFITNGKQEGQGQQWPNKQQFLVKHGVQKWPDEGTWKLCTAVSIIQTANNMDELPGNLYCPELHTLLLQCGGRFGSVDLPLPDPFLKGMEKLAVLCVRSNGLEGWKKLPPSFRNLVNLQMLQTSCLELGDIGIIKNLKNNLEILILEGYSIKELPLEIGELTRLRLLDLRKCRSLEVIPQGVISRLTRMEELYIPQAFDQWEGSEKYTEEKREGSRTSNKGKSKASLSELMSLKKLTTLYIHIPHVVLLPDDLCFENLIRFQISVGEKFVDHPQYDSSRALKLVGVHLKAKINVLINRADVLCLRKLEVLELETLFYGTHDERVSKLKYLEVIDCRDLKYLWSPLCAKGLQQLQMLSIKKCENMEGIVATAKARNEEEREDMVIDFSQLREMRLELLPKLRSFFFETEKTTEENPCITEQSLFNEKVIFPVLEKLWIRDLPNTDIWGKQSAESFCQLELLDIRSCDNVVNLIPSNMLNQLKNLGYLSIDNCPSMKSLVEGKEKEDCIIEFPQLWNLNLRRSSNLESFCSSKFEAQSKFNRQVVFPKLKYISAVDLASSITIHL